MTKISYHQNKHVMNFQQIEMKLIFYIQREILLVEKSVNI